MEDKKEKYVEVKAKARTYKLEYCYCPICGVKHIKGKGKK